MGAFEGNHYPIKLKHRGGNKSGYHNLFGSSKHIYYSKVGHVRVCGDLLIFAVSLLKQLVSIIVCCRFLPVPELFSNCFILSEVKKKKKTQVQYCATELTVRLKQSPCCEFPLFHCVIHSKAQSQTNYFCKLSKLVLCRFIFHRYSFMTHYYLEEQRKDVYLT